MFHSSHFPLQYQTGSALFWSGQLLSVQASGTRDPADVLLHARCLYQDGQFHRCAHVIMKEQGGRERAPRSRLFETQIKRRLFVVRTADNPFNNSQLLYQLADTYQRAPSELRSLAGFEWHSATEWSCEYYCTYISVVTSQDYGQF